MQEPNAFFKNLLKMAGKNFVNIIFGDSKKNNDKAIIYFFSIIVGILLFVGADSIKVLLRTNFGNKSISRIRIAIASILFFSWSGFCFLIGIIPSDFDATDILNINGGRASFVLVGVFYLIMSIAVGFIGFRERILSFSSKKSEYNEGDSIFFGYLQNHGITIETIQIKLEPFIIFIIGLVLSAINFMFGIPILICGFSLFIYQIFEYYVVSHDRIYQNLNKGRKNQDFTEAS